MANLYDFTFQLTGRKKQKACEEIIKNLKLKKCLNCNKKLHTF